MSELGDIFEPAGRMSRIMDSYHFRPGQLRAANSILESFRGGRSVTCIEAPTGTGKSLAYLIPAVLSGKKVIVSTHSKALQHQLWEKDIPLVREIIGRDIKACILKGKGNYLCRKRFLDFQKSPTWERREELGYWKPFKTWAENTETGDREELRGIPDTAEFLSWVMSSSDTCLGQSCPFADSFTKMIREQARAANIIVVNHALFFADLHVRLEDPEKGFLPDYDAVVFDEAHHLEDVACGFLGTDLFPYKVKGIVRDAEHYLASAPAHMWARSSREMQALSGRMFAAFGKWLGNRRSAKIGNEDMEHLRGVCNDFLGAVSGLKRAIARAFPDGTGESAVFKLIERVSVLASAVDAIAADIDENVVRWVEKDAKGMVKLHLTPLNINEFLEDNLWSDDKAFVLTSATLTVDRSFTYTTARLGLPNWSQSMILDEVFDYESQALLVIPQLDAEPNAEGYREKALEVACRAIKHTGGKALFLCTSYANMRWFGDQLREELGYTVLIQGETTRTELLRQFREETSSVLVATASFWEGIDVPGESLSCVLIDRIPFSPPNEPIHEARSERIDRIAGKGKSFMQYQVPRAAISLRQGVGRLIRSTEDRGVVILLDERVRTKRYGHIFVGSLPPMFNGSLRDMGMFVGGV